MLCHVMSFLSKMSFLFPSRGVFLWDFGGVGTRHPTPGTRHRATRTRTEINCRVRTQPLCNWQPTLNRAHEEMCQWNLRRPSPSRTRFPCSFRCRPPSWWALPRHGLYSPQAGTPPQKVFMGPPTLVVDPRVPVNLHPHAMARDVTIGGHSIRNSLVRFRACQNLFRTDIATLSLTNPRAAPSRVRRTFRVGQARRDQSHRVRWPELPEVVCHQEDLAQWRQHFIAVGTPPPDMFDRRMHGTVMSRFAVMSDSQHCGAFDAPITSNELRRARAQCGDPAVGSDGLP